MDSKATCYNCGKSWYARGQTGSGKMRCDECIEEAEEKRQREIIEKRENSSERKPFRMVYDPSREYAKNMVLCIPEIECGMRYGAFAPGTRIKCRKKGGVTINGKAVTIGSILIIRERGKKMTLETLRGNVYMKTLSVNPFETVLSGGAA